MIAHLARFFGIDVNTSRLCTRPPIGVFDDPPISSVVVRKATFLRDGAPLPFGVEGERNFELASAGLGVMASSSGASDVPRMHPCGASNDSDSDYGNE